MSIDEMEQAHRSDYSTARASREARAALHHLIGRTRVKHLERQIIELQTQLQTIEDMIVRTWD